MKPKALYSGWMVWSWSGALFLILLLLGSCRKESTGFVLPPGDVAHGKQLFAELSCTDCHSIADLKWTGPGDNYPEVRLGGDVTQLKTYGELVTSVINPSHKISQKAVADSRWLIHGDSSKMETYHFNDFVTVSELVDLVAFLQSEYKLVQPVYNYPYNFK